MIPYEELAAALEGNAAPVSTQSLATDSLGASTLPDPAPMEDTTLNGREQDNSAELDVDMIDEGG